jgi:Cu2+-exporting ATPase
MESSEKTVIRIFPVLQMSCAACALSVEDILKALPGVQKAEVNYASQMARVAYDPGLIQPEILKKALLDLGYDLLTVSENEAAQETERQRQKSWEILKKDTIFSLVLSLPVFILGMFFMHWQTGWYLAWILSTPVVWFYGKRFHLTALKQLRHKSANMDTLVSMSTSTAYLFSIVALFIPGVFPNAEHPPLYFEAASVVISFILLGKLLEERAKRKTGSAIQKLLRMKVKEVNRMTADGQFENLPTDLVIPGDILLAKTGEAFAVDGKVLQGESYVNESAMTGEPIPVAKGPGSEVWAGTINGEGTLHYEATKTGNDTLLTRIIQSVQAAQGSKPPVQKLADSIARIFVPTVLSVAFLTFFLWWIFHPVEGLKHGLQAFLTVLVVACPCALGLATPTALMAGMGKAASEGILIKDASCLELAEKINAVVLDKTGTLTEGKPQLEAYHIVSSEWLSGFIALESLSSHPLAQAAVRAFPDQKPIELYAIETIPGKGIQGYFKGEVIRAGSLSWFSELDIKIPEQYLDKIQAWAHHGHSLIGFSVGDALEGIFAFTDPLKPFSKEVVRRLQKKNLVVHLLSGDHTHAVSRIANACGIKHFYGNMLPEEKAAYIRQLEGQGTRCLMVGDGINDSPALATATVSMAMGNGSDVALEAAQITLLKGDIQKIDRAIELSQHIMSVIRQNLFWAFAYNIIAIPIAAGALYPIWEYQPGPMLAGAAMALSSVSVVANSLRGNSTTT